MQDKGGPQPTSTSGAGPVIGGTAGDAGRSTCRRGGCGRGRGSADGNRRAVNGQRGVAVQRANGDRLEDVERLKPTSRGRRGARRDRHVIDGRRRRRRRSCRRGGGCRRPPDRRRRSFRWSGGAGAASARHRAASRRTPTRARSLGMEDEEARGAEAACGRRCGDLGRCVVTLRAPQTWTAHGQPAFLDQSGTSGWAHQGRATTSRDDRGRAKAPIARRRMWATHVHAWTAGGAPGAGGGRVIARTSSTRSARRHRMLGLVRPG